ncbi:MAG: two-component sensor histidine kinase [Rhodocyclaceae bacterium]|jgi:two-component system osmolarity sensor histidine kinase EnvZ|nr:two-component sensor histidine kinase [Rhodocyclaceae bacterium]
MRLFPGSLLWRTFLLIALLMVLSVLAWAAIFTRSEREPRARQLAQMVVSVVNLTRTALVSAQPEKRRELLLDLSDREGIRVYPAEENEIIAPLPERAGMLRLIVDDIRNQLGEQTRVTTEREGIPAFWVSFRIDEDEYWVMLPRERVERAFTWQWLGWGSAALLLALAGAYLIMFRVTRPLKALSGAAAEIGRGRTPPPLEERGPGEIRTVAHAFNQMSRDLARLDADRALILAGISHDLRTPLARLRLSAEMSGADSATRDGMVSDIEEMDGIIGQFLDFARDTDGEPLEPTDLNALVAGVAEQFQRRGAALATDLAELPQQPLRPLAMRRLVSNLITNALRYGGESGPIELRTSRESGSVVLEVLDRGPGIPAAEAERLKQPFTRLEEARTGATGAGLGLAIVDRIARSHGGSFDLLPREGGGLVARASIPINASPK